MLKIIICFLFILSSQLVMSEDSSSQAQINALKEKVKALEATQNKGPKKGLKVADYKNEKMKSSTSEAEQLSPEDQKKLQDALKKGEKYLEERNKFLKQLEEDDD